METKYYKVERQDKGGKINARAGRVVFMAAACLLALVTMSSAQQASPAFRSKPVHSASVEKMPHSLPNSSVSVAAATNATSSRKELDRLERTGVAPRATGVGRHASVHGTTRSSTIGKSYAHGAPINFAYVGPKGGQVGHRSTATRPR